MGSASSKPARSAANAVSRRQYPKQPTAPPTAAPSAAAKAAKPQPRAQAPPQLQREPEPSQGPVYHPKERASGVKSSGTLQLRGVKAQSSPCPYKTFYQTI